MSTRPFQLADTNYMTRITRESLESILRQARTKFLPATLEHLPFLPPIARWHDGSVVEAGDGEAELILVGAELQQLNRDGKDQAPLEAVEELAVAKEEVHPREVELDYEPRNYSEQDAKTFRGEAPVSLGESAAWSTLPPIEWVLAVVVSWPAMKFMGAFLDELGHASGRSVVEWVHKSSKKARSAERSRLLTLRFEVEDGRFVSAILPFDANASADDMLAALHSANSIASFAAMLREGRAEPYDSWVRGAFIFDAGKWNFAWWTDGERVYRTNWFERNCPDPARFLGRPLAGFDLEGKSLSGGGALKTTPERGESC